MSLDTTSPSSEGTLSAAQTLREEAETAWLELVTDRNPEAIARRRAELDFRRHQLGWDDSSALERLLVDRVVLIEFQIQHADLIYGQLTEASLTQAKFLVLRAAKLEARLAQMTRALAQTRKLLSR